MKILISMNTSIPEALMLLTGGVRICFQHREYENIIVIHTGEPYTFDSGKILSFFRDDILVHGEDSCNSGGRWYQIKIGSNCKIQNGYAFIEQMRTISTDREILMQDISCVIFNC